MKTLNDWIEFHKNQSTNLKTLDKAFFAPNGFIQYVIYRLRFFFINQAMQLMLVVGEFFFLISFSAGSLFYFLLLLRASSVLVNGFWWGALERLRQRVRSLREEGEFLESQREIILWLYFSGVIAVSLILIAIAFIVSFGTNKLISFYIIVVAMQSGVEIILSCYRAGMFATRRIYQPLWSMIFPSIVTLLLLALLVPYYTSEVMPIILLISTALSSGINYYFTHKTYMVSGIKLDVTIKLTRYKEFLKEIFSVKFFSAGIAYTLIKTDAILLVIVIFQGSDSHTKDLLSSSLFLLGPVLRSNFNWARLFYFDLSKLNRYCFQKLYQKFHHRLMLTSFVVGLVSFLLALPVFMLTEIIPLYLILMAVLPLLVTQSLIAYLQMKNFCDQNYADIIFSGILFLGAIFLINQLQPQAAYFLFLVFLTCMLLIIYLLFPRLSPGQFNAEFLSLSEWLNNIHKETCPIKIHQIHINNDISSWQSTQIAKKLRRALGPKIPICRLSSHLYSWVEDKKKGPNEINPLGAGLISSHNMTEISDLSSLVTLMSKNYALGRANIGNLKTIQDEKFSIIEKFKSHFPNGEIIHTRNLNVTPESDQKNILLKSLRSLNMHFLPKENSGNHLVIAITDQGMIDTILLLPVYANRKIAADFHRMAWKYNMKETLHYFQYGSRCPINPVNGAGNYYRGE